MKVVIVRYEEDENGRVVDEIVEDLIQCKDCKFYEEFVNGRGFFCSNERIAVLCGEPTEEDFCSWAERREE